MAHNDAENTAAAARRFREIHYHRFLLGTRSNIHGACLLRSHLPVRLPRPHSMQLRYKHPPPGVGYLRLDAPAWSDSIDELVRARMVQEHRRQVCGEISGERRRAAQWLAQGKECARTHVVVATQSGLQVFVAGFGYWNVLDISLGLRNESCVAVKAFEAEAAADTEAEAAADTDAGTDAGTGAGTGAEAETDGAAGGGALPALIVALTTYVKGVGEDGMGLYRLYALGAEALPPVPQAFVDKHGIRPDEALPKPEFAFAAPREFVDSAGRVRASDVLARPKKPPAAQMGRASSVPAAAESVPHSAPFPKPAPAPRSASLPEPLAAAVAAVAAAAAAEDEGALGGRSALAMNAYAYLEERLFALRAGEASVRIDLAYLPYRISQDIVAGQPPVLLVAGNRNRVHRYAVGCNGIFEIEPVLGPKTGSECTFTAFDARTIGPYHVQITTHQEFAVALQASEQVEGGGTRRRLLVADEEVYDAAPILATVFSPSAHQPDCTAADHVVVRRVRDGAIAAGEEYDSEWPIGGAIRDGSDHPRVHALIGFVGEDAVVYHDVVVAGLDPVPTLVGGVSGRMPASAAHISGRLGGFGGIFSLAGSAREGLITAVHFDDLDYSGAREIIVGTVSGAVLIYKEVPGRGYALVWKRRFPAPAYSIFSVDINCDGANELVIVTLLGVHVMQPDLDAARRRLIGSLLKLGP